MLFDVFGSQSPENLQNVVVYLIDVADKAMSLRMFAKISQKDLVFQC
jgi:hypothetical protein